MKTIAILLTVYNRKEKTLQCLKNLYAQLPIGGYHSDVYLTDDGCTDGTPQAVEASFPAVNIFHSTGNLFWNRGMYMAWEMAAKTQDYDYYLWLNDDSFLYEKAISQLLASCESLNNKAIIVATMRSENEERTTYGGHYRGEKITPNGTLQECETFNGNCVLIPSVIFKRIGNLDWKFRHAIGDLDYGHRARKAGFKIYSSTAYSGVCEANTKLPAWARKEIPFLKRVQN